MSEYRQVHRSFWESGSVETLDPIEKLLYLYAICGPTSNMEGIYKLTLKRAAFETGIDRDMVEQLFGRLETARLAGWLDGWCCVTQATVHMPTGPQMLKHAKSLYASVPEHVAEWALHLGYKTPRGITCDTLLHNTRQHIQNETVGQTVLDDLRESVGLAPNGARPTKE